MIDMLVEEIGIFGINPQALLIEWFWGTQVPFTTSSNVTSTKYPRNSMDGTFSYIWLICMVNVGKYTIHGFYRYYYKLYKFGGSQNFFQINLIYGVF